MSKKLVSMTKTKKKKQLFSKLSLIIEHLSKYNKSIKIIIK